MPEPATNPSPFVVPATLVCTPILAPLTLLPLRAAGALYNTPVPLVLAEMLLLLISPVNSVAMFNPTEAP